MHYGLVPSQLWRVSVCLQVKCFTLYDVVLDWILMDAFDDLCNPPASVVSVVQNRWLSDGLKETAISTAVWSILKAKRRLLKVLHAGPVCVWN